jgi:hypothetical protein
MIRRIVSAAVAFMAATALLTSTAAHAAAAESVECYNRYTVVREVYIPDPREFSARVGDIVLAYDETEIWVYGTFYRGDPPRPVGVGWIARFRLQFLDFVCTA